MLGTGLMGTSIALAAIRAGDTVRGFDADQEVLSRAAGQAGFEPCRTVAACVRDADLAFVCTPIPAIPSVAAQVLVDAPAAVVSDAGSVKSHVVAEVQAKVSARNMSRFVGGHPMGGSERSGPEGASASVVDGIVWVLTPTAATDPGAVTTVETWVVRVGSQPVRMDPERHDRLVAMVSHLPQLASTALMGLAAREESGEPEILLLAAGGFRDFTRLAASNPGLWSDIVLSNKEALAAAIDLYVGRLTELRGLVQEGRAADIERSFAEAKRARLALAAKPQVKAGVAVIQVPVPDRPGALAELTAAMGDTGVNIEDLQIVHSPEGGRGIVHLSVAASTAEQALAALRAGGFPALRLA